MLEVFIDLFINFLLIINLKLEYLYDWLGGYIYNGGY